MKILLRFLDIFVTVLIVTVDLIEILTLPALFIVIGLLNAYPWQYYALTVGGYFALFAIAELVAYLIFKAFDKKYTPILERKLARFLERFGRTDK